MLRDSFIDAFRGYSLLRADSECITNIECRHQHWRKFGRASPVLNTSFATWVLELNTHLFRSKIRGFQIWYNINRKTSLSTNKTPMQSGISTNREVTDLPRPVRSFIYSPPTQLKMVTCLVTNLSSRKGSQFIRILSPLFVTCTTDFVSPWWTTSRSQTFVRFMGTNFVVVSSSNFFSNTMACSIESTKPWCWFE